jgi:hypothetical protein
VTEVVAPPVRVVAAPAEAAEVPARPAGLVKELVFRAWVLWDLLVYDLQHEPFDFVVLRPGF